MRITSLHTYPVKGCRRLDHDEARVEPWGLAGDRRWMIIDAHGVGITQRECAGLALLRALPVADGLILRAPGLPEVQVPEPGEGPKEFVRVFRRKAAVPARLADDAGRWCTDLVGRPARLAWLADPAARPIESGARDDDRVTLADGYPLLLTTEASLAALSDWLLEAGADPMPMTRFRPNIVLAGASPWAEDAWVGGRLRIGAAEFRVARACARCVVTTIDQETAAAGQQPLRMLGQRRNRDGGLMFGVSLIPDGADVIRIGDRAAVAD
ncbi:MOSC domain-containing protein [Mangrovihabitans endophyticus]|nr:MOSC N-terminal beta barrel domain-containing protein [Mangrovihabitans endophyticus]